MKTQSWSEIARAYSTKFFIEYTSLAPSKRVEYKQWLFEELLNPCRYNKDFDEYTFIGYWRAPLIQQRIAKRFTRLTKEWERKNG